MIENSEYVASEITIKKDVYARSLKANNKANKINVLIKRKLTTKRECKIMSKFISRLIPKVMKKAKRSSSRTLQIWLLKRSAIL